MANKAFTAMAAATESLGTDIQRKATHSSIWMNLIPRGTYKNGTGFEQTTFTVENSLPTVDRESWTELSSTSLSDGTADGDVGMCSTAWNDTNLGYSSVTYKPESYALRGPIICSTDLIFEHNVNAFLSAYQQELTKRAKYTLENKFQNQYARLAKKVTVSGDGGSAAVTVVDGGYDVEQHTGSGSAGDTTALSSVADDLEQGHLDLLAQELIEGGATEGDSNGWITLDAEGPVFPILIGMEASNKLAKNNSDLRSDLRYGEPNQLLKRIGASRILGNFRHVPCVMPMRYNETSSGNGVYERVNQYVESSATKGKKYTINPNWKSATHEAAIILNPSVYTAEAVRPVTSAAGLNWSPQDYSGNWKWVTGLNNISDSTTAITTGTDPFEKLGRHYCEYMFAMKPVRPDDGMVVIFKRSE